MTVTVTETRRSSKQAKTPSASPPLLVKIRFFFYILTTGHLFWLLLVLFPLDLTKSSHVHVRNTGAIRQILYTAWTNYLQLVYFPLCLYLEWRQLRGDNTSHRFRKLMHFRDVFFTTLVCPTTLYVGVFFWRIWNYDRQLLVPVEFDELLPAWMQHNLHSVNVAVCALDLCLVPRPRPRSVARQLLVLNAFVLLYMAGVVIVKAIVGYWPYPLFHDASPSFVLMLSATMIVEHNLFYHAQWYVNKLFWSSTLEPDCIGGKRRNLG